ncbi:hypothetical protein B0I35DRAFT_348902 [Stachybotrys elegans]|uniref:RRM domain-containing protein n=1 Tax=Stachybotrys elegans TaxID=80388 RepID=A0A8K0SX51_9HYPO|nr:hypothetical protein B0I35DRAFT_348902 [Stachybotrys elegans]
MPEPEAQLQATANLSPVSPSPVHTAATLAVPALQETVDTIDAMVAAAMASDGTVDQSAEAPVVHDTLVDVDNDGIVDDDSFDDAYGEDIPEATTAQQQPVQQPDDNDNDDYAKTFDSPIGPGEGEDGGDEGETLQQDVSSLTRESNNLSLTSDYLTTTTSRPLDDARAVPEPSALLPGAADATPAPPAARIKADPHPVPASSSASSQSTGTQQQDGQSAQSRDAARPAITAFVASQDPSADIQQLVADLTSQPVDSASNPDQSDNSVNANAEQATSSTSPVSALPPSSSLPPRPPLPQTSSQSYAAQHHPPGVNSSVPPSAVAPPTPGQPSTYVTSAVPGTTADGLGGLPPPPATGLNAPVAVTSINAPPFPADRSQDVEYQRQWDQFMVDERQYMSEAKWDRFPEGSRIFIGTRSASGASQTGAHIFSTGNLSSDKVSKRDVFDLFHRFGRLAQISLKSAYGFVQYHTVEEGQRALDNLQGIEIKGRRVHLEISRVQDKSKKDRARSPDRERGRGRDASRRNDRYSQQNRDDYRPGRNQSPRRNDYHSRENSFGGRDRGSYGGDRGRGRSQSPGYRRQGKDSYRRRSPSPYSRPQSHTELDLPRRYGADVPDVQIILQPDVSREFVSWVEGAFKTRGLKTEVMYLHPRFPKEQVIQRQAAEGVHAVVDLNIRAQSLGRIPVQAFDRSGGISNVRFDQYVDLDPSTAAEVILRAKASGQTSYGQGYAAPGGYAPPYGAHVQQPAHGGGFPAQPPSAYPPQPAVATADIASLLGQVDGATLQRLISSVQQGQGGLTNGGGNPGQTSSSQVDIQAILGSLHGGGAPQHAAPAYANAYAGQPGAGSAPGGTGDAAAQVQNIMAQLARYRQ